MLKIVSTDKGSDQAADPAPLMKQRQPLGVAVQLGSELIDGAWGGGQLNRFLLISLWRCGDQLRLIHGVAKAGAHAGAEAIAGEGEQRQAGIEGEHANGAGIEAGGVEKQIGAGHGSDETLHPKL